ncbi:hypothetical protein ACWEPI_08390 [Streptomyces sp. NPDC004262]
MNDLRIPDGILVSGGPLDGRTLPLYGDPLSPPDSLRHQDAEGVHVYTPRPLGGAAHGSLWLYVYIRTEPAR